MKTQKIAFIGSIVLAMGIFVAEVGLADSDRNEIHSGTIRIENHSEAEFPAMAKIPMEQAIRQALTSIPGQVLKAELEDENGFLVYGVEIASADKSIMEVKVDAGSGKVLAVERDTMDREVDDNDSED